MEWSKKQEVIAGEKMTNKQRNNLKIEGRVLKQLEFLKAAGGPFTSVEAVDSYMSSDLSEKVKTQRLKTEVQYSRDTSLSLSKNNGLFPIRGKKIGDKNMKQLTSVEFATNIKRLLTQKLCAADKIISLNRFMTSLDRL